MCMQIFRLYEFMILRLCSMRGLFLILMTCVFFTGCQKQQTRNNKKNTLVSVAQKDVVDTKQVLAGYMMFPDLPLDAQNVSVQEIQIGIELSVSYDSLEVPDRIMGMYIQDMEWLGWDLVMQHVGNERSVLTYQAPVWDCVIIIESIQHKKCTSRVQIVQKKKSSL